MTTQLDILYGDEMEREIQVSRIDARELARERRERKQIERLQITAWALGIFSLQSACCLPVGVCVQQTGVEGASEQHILTDLQLPGV